jgi:Ni/Fe-hydrogenase subunit HybB-like protein
MRPLFKTQPPLDPRATKQIDPIHSYPRFLAYALGQATEGTWKYFGLMAVLAAVALVGANAWANQVAQGMAVTGLTDHVSWGLYIANFTFAVGLAAGAVMMVIPAYLYHSKDMYDVVIVGEILAVAAIIVCLLFVTVDMGRPERFWHIIPLLGRFNWPLSMLTWDVIVLDGYLLINLHVAGYLMYMRFLGKRPDKRWYLPFVFLSIFWAVSIHTVTAFLYSGLGGRPFWNSALLAPRFIASAFITGPAFVILLLQAMQRYAHVHVGQGAIVLLYKVAKITVLLNIFMFLSELFTSIYAGGAHASAVRYLFVGLHGKAALVPWIWSAMFLNVSAAIMLHLPATRAGNKVLLSLACVAAFCGVWIEKGMGLIIPGFVPSTLHEVVQYIPTSTEWRITWGIWAFGFMVLLAGLKMAKPVLASAFEARLESDESQRERTRERRSKS